MRIAQNEADLTREETRQSHYLALFNQEISDTNISSYVAP